MLWSETLFMNLRNYYLSLFLFALCCEISLIVKDSEKITGLEWRSIWNLKNENKQSINVNILPKLLFFSEKYLHPSWWKYSMFTWSLCYLETFMEIALNWNNKISLFSWKLLLKINKLKVNCSINKENITIKSCNIHTFFRLSILFKILVKKEMKHNLLSVTDFLLLKLTLLSAS